MAEEAGSKDLATTGGMPEKTVIAAPEPGPATAEAIRKAPEAVRRSMPMGLSIALGILLAGLLGWLFQTLVWFLLVLYLSFIAATIFEAPVQWLKKTGLRRGFASIIVMVGTAALVISMLVFAANSMYSQVSALSTNLKKAPDRINAFINGTKKQFPGIGEKLGDFDISKEVSKAVPDVGTLWANAMYGVEAVSWLVIMFFIVLYMLVDGADHLKGVRRLIPKHARLESTRLFNEVAKAHRGWALATLTNVGSASIMTGTGLWMLGVPGAWVLGIAAGLGELIPNIGPVLGAVPALAITLLAAPETFLYVVIMFIVVQTIQSYTLSPMMLKFSVELPVLVTIISVLVFGMLFGFLGILVAIPLVADMVVLWQYANRYLEKDVDDYDAVNSPADGQRQAASPDNTSPSRLKKLFRRARRNPGTGGTPATPAQPGSGLAALAEAERRAGTASPATSPNPVEPARDGQARP